MNSYRITRKRFFGNLSITTYLILINVVAFFLAVLFGFLQGNDCQETVCRFIALQPSMIFQGQYLWTFLTSMFMHGGYLHLFVNMFSLMFIGSLVERILGAKRYLWFYLISGFFAGFLYTLIAYFSNASFPAVGASGALFGLVGLLVLLTPNLSVYLMFIPIPIKMKYAGPGILFLLWLISSVANVGIGNTAHLGGLIAGLAYGFYLKKKFPRKTRMISAHFR